MAPYIRTQAPAIRRLTLSTLLALLIVGNACSRTGLKAPARPPGGMCPVGPTLLPIFPVPGLAPTCLLGTPIGLTGGTVAAILASGGFVGATTDVRFSRFVVSLTWTDGGVACGSPTFPTTNTINIVFTGLRYRAENNLAAPCVSRSRIDFTGVSMTTAAPPSLPLAFWMAGVNIAGGPGAALLPALDGAALPIATAASTSCPLSLTTLPSGVGTRCNTWSELPR